MASMNWKEPETRSKFFLAVLASNETTAVSNAKANSIAQYMGCTPKAVQHQLTALRKEIDALKSGNFISGAAANGTPKSASPAKKRRTKDGSVEKEEDSGTPSKKPKTTKKTANTKQGATTEGEEGNDDIAARKDAAEGRDGGEDEDED